MRDTTSQQDALAWWQSLIEAYIPEEICALMNVGLICA